MKNILSIFLLITFILPKICQAQLGLGQTKEYIMDQKKKCRIELNTKTLLVFSCDEFTDYYAFDDSTGLCWFEGTEFKKEDQIDFLFKMIENGYKIKSATNYPILLALKGGNENESSTSIILDNDKYMVAILEYDLEGKSSSGKFGVYFEFSPEDKSKFYGE